MVRNGVFPVARGCRILSFLPNPSLRQFVVWAPRRIHGPLGGPFRTRPSRIAAARREDADSSGPWKSTIPEHAGESENIAQDGMCFATDLALSVGKVVEVLLKMPE
jgi:hypothetical protein